MTHVHEWTRTSDPDDEVVQFGCISCEVTTVQCASCWRPLAAGEEHACGVCVGRMRGTLTRLPGLYDQLPSAVRGLVGVDYSRASSGRSAVSSPLLGGDAVVMMAGGSGSGVVADRHGRRSPQDQHETDPPSVSGVLADIEDSWRRARGSKAAPYRPSPRLICTYLLRHVEWAAGRYEGWAADFDTVRDLEHRIERLLGWGPDEERLPAPCPHCGGVVVRRWVDAGPKAEGGHTEWACTSCAASTSAAAVLERVDDDVVLTAPQLAVMLDVPLETVRTWVKRRALIPTGDEVTAAGRRACTYRLGDAREAAQARRKRSA